MTGVYKFKASEGACNTTASTFSGSKLVRLVPTTGDFTVTQKEAGGGTIAVFTIMSTQPELIVEKAPTDTLESNNAGQTLKAAPIAYRN